MRIHHLRLAVDQLNKIIADLEGIDAAKPAAPRKKILSARDVLEIKQLYHAGSATQRELAERYGVTQPLISMIVRGKAYRVVKAA